MDQLKALALKATLGNTDAAIFLLMTVSILHVWDDLIDRDKDLSDSDINTAFRNALIDLPRNQFYRKYFDELNPTLSIAITNWLVANTLERNEDADYQECAFIIRSTYVDLVTATATICGGAQHGYEIGMQVRRLAHKETFNGYKANLVNEKTTREGLQNEIQ